MPSRLPPVNSRRHRTQSHAFANLDRVVGSIGSVRLIKEVGKRGTALFETDGVDVGQIVGDDGQRLRCGGQSGKWNRKIRHGLTLL